MDFWEIKERLDRIKAQKKKFYRKRKNFFRQLVQNLFLKGRQKGGISLPYPSAFALDRLDEIFSGLENIDFSKRKHVAICLFVLQNQNDQIEYLSNKQIEEEANKLLRECGEEDIQQYAHLIADIFIDIKKKQIRYQKKILEETLKMLTLNQLDGEKLFSSFTNKQGNRLNISTKN